MTSTRRIAVVTALESGCLFHFPEGLRSVLERFGQSPGSVLGVSEHHVSRWRPEEGRFIVDEEVAIRILSRQGCPQVKFGSGLSGNRTIGRLSPIRLLAPPVFQEGGYCGDLGVVPVRTHPAHLREIPSAEALPYTPVGGDGLTIDLLGMPEHNQNQWTQGLIARTRGKRRNGNRLYVPVEGPMIPREEFVVVQVSRPAGAEEADYEAAAAPSYPARCLDIRGGRLGLAVYDHEPEPGHVYAGTEHRSRKRGIGSVRCFVCEAAQESR